MVKIKTTSMSIVVKLIVVLVLTVLFGVGGYFVLSAATNPSKKATPPPPGPSAMNLVDNSKPPPAHSRPTTMGDCRYPDLPRGWYGFSDHSKETGQKLDFCRWVGEKPNQWWTCALHGITEMTPKEDMQKYFESPSEAYSGGLVGHNC
jgi:hypothetical protein